jgi:hypothetical protein
MGRRGQNIGFAFRSGAFNTTEPRDYFINPCCFGDDAARWLIAELRKRGVATDEEPGQEDFGWYFGFEAAGVRYLAILGFRPDEEDGGEGEWLCTFERDAGILASMFGKRRDVGPEAAEAMRQAFNDSTVITSVRSGPESEL